MKIFNIILRSVFGLFLLFASVSYFLKLGEQPAAVGAAKTFFDGLEASRYLMPLVKIIELLTGLCFLTGRFVTIANLVLLPVTINILLINLFLVTDALPFGIILLAANVYFISTKWSSYRPIFAMR